MRSFIRWQNHADNCRMLNTSSKVGIGAIAAKAHFVRTVNTSAECIGHGSRSESGRSLSVLYEYTTW